MEDTKEVYRKWTPLDHAPTAHGLAFESLNDDKGELSIILIRYISTADSGRRFRVLFEQPLAYRVADEFDRGRMIGLSLDSDRFEKGRGLYYVEHSSWVEQFDPGWFEKLDGDRDAAAEVAQETGHYAFITNGPWIDVLSKTAPLTEWLEN